MSKSKSEGQLKVNVDILDTPQKHKRNLKILKQNLKMQDIT